jgi:hypothetical protein
MHERGNKRNARSIDEVPIMVKNMNVGADVEAFRACDDAQALGI